MFLDLLTYVGCPFSSSLLLFMFSPAPFPTLSPVNNAYFFYLWGFLLISCVLLSNCCFSVSELCWLFVTPWTAACQASPSFTLSWNLLNSCPLSWGLPYDCLILCCPFSCLQSFTASGLFLSWLSASVARGRCCRLCFSINLTEKACFCWWYSGVNLILAIAFSHVTRQDDSSCDWDFNRDRTEIWIQMAVDRVKCGPENLQRHFNCGPVWRWP